MRPLPFTFRESRKRIGRKIRYRKLSAVRHAQALENLNINFANECRFEMPISRFSINFGNNRNDFAVTPALVKELTEFGRSCRLVVCRGFATIGTMSEVRRGGKYKRGE